MVTYAIFMIMRFPKNMTKQNKFGELQIQRKVPGLKLSKVLTHEGMTCRKKNAGARGIPQAVFQAGGGGHGFLIKI